MGLRRTTHEVGHDRDGVYGDASTDRSRRLLYWWAPPVRPEDSADVGRDLLVFCAVWFLTILAIAILVLAIAAATG